MLHAIIIYRPQSYYAYYAYNNANPTSGYNNALFMNSGMTIPAQATAVSLWYRYIHIFHKITYMAFLIAGIWIPHNICYHRSHSLIVGKAHP